MDDILAAVDARDEEHVKNGGTLRQRKIDPRVFHADWRRENQSGHQTCRNYQPQYIDKVQLEAAGVDGWPSADELWAMALAATK